MKQIAKVKLQIIKIDAERIAVWHQLNDDLEDEVYNSLLMSYKALSEESLTLRRKYKLPEFENIQLTWLDKLCLML